ncbi:MAG: hypothetical protein ABIO31_13705 [Candidatus Nitrotoga sp.]
MRLPLKAMFMLTSSPSDLPDSCILPAKLLGVAVCSPIPVITSPLWSQRAFHETLFPTVLMSDIWQLLSPEVFLGSLSPPLVMHTLVALAGIAKGIPGISILEETSQYSPGAAYAAALNMLVIMARMAVRYVFMIVP